jgi:hypothetical protein
LICRGWTHTVRALMTSEMALRSPLKRWSESRNISISRSVHFLSRSTPQSICLAESNLNVKSYPAVESAEACSCIVNSPSLLNAEPAAAKISPTCKLGFRAKKRDKRILNTFDAEFMSGISFWTLRVAVSTKAGRNSARNASATGKLVKHSPRDAANNNNGRCPIRSVDRRAARVFEKKRESRVDNYIIG